MVNKYYKSSFVEFLCSNNKTWSNEEQRWCPQNTKNLKIKMISIHLIMTWTILDIISSSMNSRVKHGQHRRIKFLKLISKFISNSFLLHREPTTVSVIFMEGFSNVSRMWKRPLNWSCVDCLCRCVFHSHDIMNEREMCTICYITTSEPFITKIRAPWITDCLWKLSLFRILKLHSWIKLYFDIYIPKRKFVFN